MSSSNTSAHLSQGPNLPVKFSALEYHQESFSELVLEINRNDQSIIVFRVGSYNRRPLPGVPSSRQTKTMSETTWARVPKRPMFGSHFTSWLGFQLFVTIFGKWVSFHDSIQFSHTVSHPICQVSSANSPTYKHRPLLAGRQEGVVHPQPEQVQDGIEVPLGRHDPIGTWNNWWPLSISP